MRALEHAPAHSIRHAIAEYVVHEFTFPPGGGPLTGSGQVRAVLWFPGAEPAEAARDGAAGALARDGCARRRQRHPASARLRGGVEDPQGKLLGSVFSIPAQCLGKT